MILSEAEEAEPSLTSSRRLVRNSPSKVVSTLEIYSPSKYYLGGGEGRGYCVCVCVCVCRGGFRGAGGGRPPPSGIRPPADPKGPPFDTFSEIHFWPTDPKIFLKAPLAPIYTNFEGERAPKKRFFDCFFKNLPAAQKILPK